MATKLYTVRVPIVGYIEVFLPEMEDDLDAALEAGVQAASEYAADLKFQSGMTRGDGTEVNDWVIDAMHNIVEGNFFHGDCAHAEIAHVEDAS